MTIESITLSIFELPGNTPRLILEEVPYGRRTRWRATRDGAVTEEVHVLHVRTSDGIEGICTVGDARYTTMRPDDLDHLRILTIGEDPFDRERLNHKLDAATRFMFTRPGWFGAFDNCLWDIAGKATGLPVYALLGRARASCPAYYNIRGNTRDAVVGDAQEALSLGFSAIKDHFSETAEVNIDWCTAVRETVGDEVDLLHDAVGSDYTFEEALRVGRAMGDLGVSWLEEPLPDRSQQELQRLCNLLDIPVLAAESLMHDHSLCAQWVRSGATDLLRGNARHGVTPLLKLAHMTEMHGTTIELNGPGGLFGLVHAHLVCAIQNTSYYEYFPGGSRDEKGKTIGLTNPPLPHDGHITPPDTPGWGAEWDRDYFEKHRVAVR